MPRKIFIVCGLIALLVSAFITYVNFFGVPTPRALKKFLRTRSPYEAEAQQTFNAIAGVQSLQLTGVVSGSTGYLGLGLDSFTSRVSSTIAFMSELVAVQLQTQTEFTTIGRTTYTATVEVRRPSVENFYFFVSRATAPPEVASQIATLLRRWVRVANDLVAEIAPEQVVDIGVDEPQLIIAARATLQKVPLASFTRKINDMEFEFSISGKNLALFLGTLFGDISGQQFTDEELLTLQDSLKEYAIFGRVIIDPTTKLPQHVTFNQGVIRGELDVTYPTTSVPITAPSKATDIHELLGQ